MQERESAALIAESLMDVYRNALSRRKFSSLSIVSLPAPEDSDHPPSNLGACKHLRQRTVDQILRASQSSSSRVQ